MKIVYSPEAQKVTKAIGMTNSVTPATKSIKNLVETEIWETVEGAIWFNVRFVMYRAVGRTVRGLD